jgi:hypothetical protein
MLPSNKMQESKSFRVLFKIHRDGQELSSKPYQQTEVEQKQVQKSNIIKLELGEEVHSRDESAEEEPQQYQSATGHKHENNQSSENHNNEFA